GFTGWIARHQQPLLVTDIHGRQDILPKEDLQNFPYRSFIGAPLRAGDKFLGTLELVAEPPHFYDYRDLAVLEITANQAAIAMDYARRFSLTDQQLQLRAHQLAGLQRLSRELNSTLDLDKILDMLLDEAMRITGADFGNVSLYDVARQEFTAHKEQYGEQIEPIAEPEFPTVPARPGLMTRPLEDGQPFIAHDLLAEEGTNNRPRNTRSQVTVPILYREEPVGIINLESLQPGFFTEDQIRYLEALANHAAVAIGNAQAYQEQISATERASRRAEQLSRLAEISSAFRTNLPLEEILEDVAFAILESVGFNVVLVSLIEGDPPLVHHTVGAGIPLPQMRDLQATTDPPTLDDLMAVLQDEFRLNHAYFIPAEQKELWLTRLKIPLIERPPRADQRTGPAPWQSGDLLLVPLHNSQGQTIGLITVQNPDTGLRPEPLTLQTLEIFANHAAAAIENARMFEQEQQRRRFADTLRGVAETISSQLARDELLNIVLQELKKVVDYDAVSVQLLEEDRLVVIGGQGWENSDLLSGISIPVRGHNPNRQVIETQEVLIIGDVQKTYPAAFSKPPYNRVHGWLGVPLTYGTNILGMMEVASYRPDCFSREDAEIVNAFANQVAIALQNARLFEEARQQVRQLAALTEVAQSINRALNLDEILNQVLDAVFDLVNESNGSIWLVDTETNTLKIANTRNIPNFLVDALNESGIPLDAEPFASVIKSGQISVVSSQTRPNIIHADVSHQPFPEDVTYVPLKTEDSVIGILAIETVIHRKSTLDLVTTLANLAAVAIENARLVQRLNLLTEHLEQRVEERTRQLAQALEELTDERDRVETLYRITRELTTSLDLDRVLTEALSLINRAIGISQGAVLLLDHGSGDLIYRAALGRETPLPRGGEKTPYRLGYGLAGVVMETNRPRIVPDLSRDPDWIPTKENDERRSALVTPLTTGEGLMGALLLFHPEPNYFTEDHLRLVSAAGAQIANAINNAELYRLITDQAERLGVMLRTQATEAARNEAILNGIADGVLVLDSENTVILINPKAAEILGVEDAVQQPLRQILAVPDSGLKSELRQQFYRHILDALAEIQHGAVKADFRIEVEQTVLVVTLTPVALGAEERIGAVAVIRDISREAEIERLKNEFISTVSHELRTPLTSIKGYADLLVKATDHVGELNPLQQRFVKVIQANANRLTELVNDILEISRIETGRITLKFEALDILEVIREVAVSFEGQLVQKSMDLSLDLPDQLPAVWADRGRLIQIITNLVGNAWQYTPEGGKIIVRARKSKGNYVQVDVEDTGIGIPAEDIPHIFDRFFRSERHEVQLVDGTGLGLSITQSFVEMLGGKIWVKSQVDVGTTFSFTVPLAEPETAGQQPDTEISPQPEEDL
ncbi:MAG: GAF domain-containing protein, partial [Chloroflexi bacterium]